MATPGEPLDPRRAAALDRILRLVLILNADMSESLGRRGLSGARAPVIWHLRHHGPSTQRALADAVGSTPRNVTGLVDGLERDGFVARTAHPTDRRATLVVLTDKGRAVADDLRAEQLGFASVLFDGMPTDRFDGLVAGLDDVLARIEAEQRRLGQ